MTRDDLKNYKYNQEFIEEQLEYIKEQKTTLFKITTTLNDMPIGSRKVEDSMAEKLAKLMDFFDNLLDNIHYMQKKQEEIMKQLLKVEQPYRNILYKIYIQGKSLVKVADEMGYSYREICRKHGTALNKFEEE